MAKKQELQDKRFELYERAHTKEYFAVAKWLSEVKFTPAVFGVDQADVWRKMEKLCELYEAALDAERARNAKLERKLRSVSGNGRPEPQVKQEPIKDNSESSAADAVSFEAGPAKQERKAVRSDVPAPIKPEPVQKESVAPPVKAASQEELILQDLLREFGPKGGEPNG